MRLLFLLRQLNTGGAQRQVVELVRSLDPSFDITVLTFYPGGAFESAMAGLPRARLVTINKPGRWGMLVFFWRLTKAVRAAKPDVIHSYLVFPNVVAALLGIVFPRVKVVWGIRQADKDVSHLPWADRMAFRVERLLSRFADLIIFNSETGRRHYGYPRSIVIPNGIDTSRFKPLSPVSKRDEIVFGVVGRIDPVKDQLNFVRAAAIVRDRVPRARFVLIGPESEPYTSAVRSEVDRLGLREVVRFTGSADVDASTYAGLDVFVSSSPSEGFPNAVAEALACGKRCVVTNAGDSAAIAGSYGMVVPPRDPEALADGMIRVLDLDVDLDAAARSVAERYDTKLLAQRTADALRRLIDRDARSAS